MFLFSITFAEQLLAPLLAVFYICVEALTFLRTMSLFLLPSLVFLQKPRQARCMKVDMKSVVPPVLFSTLVVLIVSLVFNGEDNLKNVSDVIGSFLVLVLLSRPVTLIGMLMCHKYGSRLAARLLLQTPCPWKSESLSCHHRVSFLSKKFCIRTLTLRCTFRQGSLGCNLGSRRLNPRSYVNEADAFVWTVYEIDRPALSNWHRSFVFFDAMPPDKRVTKVLQSPVFQVPQFLEEFVDVIHLSD